MSLVKLLSLNNRLMTTFARNVSQGYIVFNKSPIENYGQSNNPSFETSAPDVPGLSTAVVKDVPEKFVPGTSKSGDYKNPEYFSYNKESYFEAEIEMLKYRCPQPSAVKK